MFNDERKVKYLFKCSDCSMIVVITLEEDEDIKSVQNDQMQFDCPCGGLSYVLRD